jgi:DNA repair protein RecN (Recombination protein N)
LNSVASGGEKSRLMLAIKAVQTAHASARTIILDEIDTGVSGQVADCMAQLMDCMAQHQQVIAVTHLPQVAGHATHHMKVSKLTSPEAVHTQVTHLTPEGRVQELAEMLSGAQVTSAATDHAISLLQRS